MKILIIAPTPFFADRGTHIRILEEALALEKRGHNLTIATYHIGKDIDNRINSNIDIRRIRRLIFWYKKLEAGPDWQKIILDFMLIRKVFYLARTQKPEIIHAHLHEGVLIGWIVQKLLFWRKIKLVADFHGGLVSEMKSHGYLKGGLLWKIFSKLEKFIDKLGDYALTSSWENTEVIKLIRNKKDVETILDGVNPDYYQDFLLKENLKKELELPSDKVIVCYTGSLLANKGINYLMRAILNLGKKRDDLYFIVAGFPTEKVKEYVEENNLSEKTRLVNPLSYFDLPKILGACDIAVDPKDSQTSQASGKILQYMAAGLPVVCFNRPNNRKYLEEGAYFSGSFDAEGLSKGIEFFADNAGERKIRGEYNRKRAQIFSWDAPAEKVEKIYKKLRDS